MEEIATYQQSGLPEKIEDVAHFLLIAPEKATALRAEIRAINKVGLAKEVYDQKLEEQRRLCDMILDASVRLGEMTKEIPKAPVGRKPEIKDSAVHNFEKPKSEAVRDLGFSPKQVQRFETLADNKDLVELEKVKAKEEGRMPTRTNVIDLAKERKRRMESEKDIIDVDYDNLKTFRKATAFADIYTVTDEILDSVVRADSDLGGTIQCLNDLIGAVAEIRDKLILKGAKHGKTERN